MAIKTRRSKEGIDTNALTGPHAGYDRYGDLDHYYYRCERCDIEIVKKTVHSRGFEHAPDCSEARR